MIQVAGAILAIVISLCWYLPGIKAQGENKVLTRKDYIRTAFMYGFLFTCLLIIITEITWDGIVKRTPLSGLSKDIISDFLRAALLEELFKFLGFKLAKKKLGLTRKTDYIMIAGLMGLVYGIVEKAVQGNLVAIVMGLLIPLHIMWQFNQGGHYYEYERQKEAGNAALARKEWMMAIILPFILHGLWDSGLDISSYFINLEPIGFQILGFLIFVLLLILGAIYSVKTLKKVKSVAKDSYLPNQENYTV